MVLKTSNILYNFQEWKKLVFFAENSWGDCLSENWQVLFRYFKYSACSPLEIPADGRNWLKTEAQILESIINSNEQCKTPSKCRFDPELGYPSVSSF